jgi:quercetin dioxygenase-like cupin family protein
LVQFAEEEGVGEHVNDEVDVLFVGVSGSGEVCINGRLHCLSGGTLIFIPKGARRSTCGTSADFAYLAVHQRRGPLKINVPRRDVE